MIKIDARGCACPEPVLKVKKASDKKNTEIEVTVDTAAAFENIKRFARSSGYDVTHDINAHVYTLTLTKATDRKTD